MTGPGGRHGLTTGVLLSDGWGLLRRNPRVVFAFFLAGLVVAGVDALRRGDPVPTVGFVGLLDGKLSVTFGLVPRITPHAGTPPSSIVSLRPRWLVRTVGLELLRTGAVVGAGVYGFARLLGTGLRPAATFRYLAVFTGVAMVDFTADVGFLFGVLLLAVAFAVLVRLVAVPAFLVVGESIPGALGRSWHRTEGYGWTLFGVVLVVGFANHALSSIPTVGPVGSALAAAVQVGVVAGFLRRVR
jgi:hypothetical protein